MLIDDELMSYLEDLSCLSLTAEEKRRIAVDLQKILEYMERLERLDTDGVPERSHPFDNVNVFRDDKIGTPLDRALILKNAPDSDGVMFIAPKTVE
ncbi:MAG: Asp-tRNA(Asn)/Glu-tRNA(Gln) amidotransferase subunit GatC [Oscillospiraceae bacterium]|nr:Asp-tRNA(Asn)/Glu-tRNA(Gln) amidotransferase subunit GatC [Oscillospiraceae bacterium]